MKNKYGPVRPYILISQSVIYICQSENALTQATVYGISGDFFINATAFDKNGMLWRVSQVATPYPLNSIRIILARTIFNPRVSIDVQWKSCRKFELEELKNSLRSIINSDSGVITQFISEEVLKSEIDTAFTFENLLENLRAHVLVE